MIAEVKAALLRTAEIIETNGLAKGCYALTAEGVDVSPQSDHAATFCTLGALHRATGCEVQGEYTTEYSIAARVLSSFVFKKTTCSSIPVWNDRASATPAEIAAGIRAAIALAETEDGAA